MYNKKTAVVSITTSITPLTALSGQVPVVRKVTVPAAALVVLLEKFLVTMSPVRREKCVWLSWAC